jgi:hypothetical protein
MAIVTTRRQTSSACETVDCGSAMSSVPIAHYQNRASTPAVPARVAALRFALDCHAKKEAATSRVSRPQDAERRSSDGARDIIQDTK